VRFPVSALLVALAFLVAAGLVALLATFLAPWLAALLLTALATLLLLLATAAAAALLALLVGFVGLVLLVPVLLSHLRSPSVMPERFRSSALATAVPSQRLLPAPLPRVFPAVFARTACARRLLSVRIAQLAGDLMQQMKKLRHLRAVHRR
jgi:hypothetical protein